MKRRSKVFSIIFLTAILAAIALLTCKSLFNELAQKAGENVFSNAVNFKKDIWIKKYPGKWACFKFEMPDGTKVVTDPYCMDETVKADIVTESHQHLDHTDVSKLTGNYKLIKTTGDFFEKGVKISGFAGKHDKIDNEVTNIMFLFKINGITIAHLGSQGAVPDEAALNRLRDTDVLIIQVFSDHSGFTNKLNVDECISIIQRLHPKIVIPDHGTKDIGLSIAAKLGEKLESVKTGEVGIKKSELNGIKTTRIIDLDRDGVNEKINFQ